MIQAPAGIARFTAVAAAASVLTSGLSGSASARVAPVPHVTLAAAAAVLPAATTLPGGPVKLLTRMTSHVSGQLGICNKTVTLHNLGRAAAVYSSKTSPAVTAAGTDWTVAVAVFATPVEAATAMRTVIAVEGRCPTRQVYKGTGAHIGIHVTASARYSVTGWSGYRTVERQVIYIGKTATSVTQIVVMLVRGNALVTVAEASTGTQVSPTVQETRRKLAQTRLLAALAHSKP